MKHLELSRKLSTEERPWIIAFINFLYCAVVYKMHENKKVPLSDNVISIIKSNYEPAKKLCRAKGIPSKVFDSFVHDLLENRPLHEEIAESAKSLRKAIRESMEDFQKDLLFTNEEIETIKAILSWIQADSAAGFKKLRKHLHSLNLDKNLFKEFSFDESDPTLSEDKLKALVKFFTGRENSLELSLEERVAAKEKDEQKYKEFLAASREAKKAYEDALLSIINQNNGRPMSVYKVQDLLEQKGVRSYLPKGFHGFVGAGSVLYTAKGKKIDGTTSAPVTMNPNYDPEKDNTYVFSYQTPGTKTVTQVRTVAFNKQNSQVKQQVVSSLMDSLQKEVRPKWLRDLKGSLSTEKFLATILELVYETCARIGSVGNEAKGESTYGITTLLVKHFKKVGSKYHLEFIGKDLVPAKYVLSPVDANMTALISNIERLLANKKPDDLVFLYKGIHLNANRANAYFKTISGNPDVTIHKIRHVRGTLLMKDVLKKIMPDDSKNLSQSQANDLIKQAATEVGKLLNHFRGVGTTNTVTPTTALKSYILPEFLHEFFTSRNLRIPTFVPKK